MSISSARLAARVPALAEASVLCVGDAMLDSFVYGDVHRISPEAPIPIFNVCSRTEMPGGSGNVLRNLATLQASAAFVAAIGADPAGGRLRALLGALPTVSLRFIVRGDTPTICKTRFVAGVQQMLRVDEETIAALGPPDEERVIGQIDEALPASRTVILSDYGKGVLTPGIIRWTIRAAGERGIPVIVDPKGSDYGRYAGATLVTPNRRELHEATGLPCGSDGEIVAAAEQLIRRHRFQAVLATRSQEGMTLVTQNGAVFHLPAEAREVFDVSGAGDTVVATLAAALAVGVPLADAARMANAAAGVVVGKRGTAVCQPDELAIALRHPEADAGRE